MNRFLFTLWVIERGQKSPKTHEENHETLADAMMRARAILNEAKRDGCGMQIDLYQSVTLGWKHCVSYQ